LREKDEDRDARLSWRNKGSVWNQLKLSEFGKIWRRLREGIEEIRS
jgi:hypothetical protein